MNIKEKILERLITAKGPVSGEILASELEVSRAAIWKHIKALRDEGYMIESSPNIGYSLVSSPDRLSPAGIKAGLKTSIIGKNIQYFNEIESTNTIAREVAGSVEEGTVIIAESQTGGRGRMGRKWISPEGGIWLSLILKPRIQPLYASRITLLAGVSVAKTIRSYGLLAGIKWPNDVLINGKKVCGILTEIEAEIDVIDYCIVGIGIDANVDTESFPEEVRESSTSLKKELGHEVDRAGFVQRLIEEFEALYLKFQRDDFSSILDEWRDMSATIGEWVKITTRTRTIYGEAVGVDSEGALILETGEGKLEKIVAGTCEHLRRP
ncbi:biotin-(acetyl-CoA carboxylase) ligase [Candidatus Methanoperedens nitroreducens]|uniref:Biotin-(Acetyl-CoA carboxylase) ligase n=1 Tax=Candidatus Methanoperedens nitratireducens TaxID=1392998 RepID=A0A062V387_9EURY|nr:biotin--[acetyl-CoA-carboxylase] ligase [Candidatus Methanoperedens nitroreducens]KCZ70289.1 biotin-(acetyl-CoA carboxylase) ligase [Candidatus Methanoperedens nitroreducens]MDJ1423129.1 biotin--[acetyl-CoA-carboxylase] ligase [Candidatus Methanoperedens sp.]